MERLEHILICLDLTEMDDSLIRYGNFLVEHLRPEEVSFLHVLKLYEIPPELYEAFPHLDQPLHEIVREELEEKIEKNFMPKHDVRLRVEVAEGSTTDNIVRYARENNVPLTLMGKKVGYEGQGGIVRKVLGIIPSSVLLISETSQPRLEHILVRMDFSKMSALALNRALQLQKLIGSKTSCHHVYKLPLQYFPQSSPVDDKKLNEQVEIHGLKEYKKFIKKYNYNPDEISFSVSLDPENDEADMLYRKAINIGADIIFIGSKLKSELSGVIVDNTSEKLASTEKVIPILLVKDRKQSMGFLKSLFE